MSQSTLPTARYKLTTSLGYQDALLLSTAGCIVSPALYIILEMYSVRGFEPGYSSMKQLTSELAIPYSFTSRFDGYVHNSTRHAAMNWNFVQSALMYLPGHFALLKATRHNPSKHMRIARVMSALLRSLGLIMIVKWPGGPREQLNGDNRWHVLGAVFAIFFGNLNHILSGLSMPKHWNPMYRRSGVLMGSCGLAAMAAFFTVATFSTKGFWQRLAIYPTTVGDLVCAFALLTEVVQTTGAVKQS